jgi:hypothetical protein
VIFAATSSTHFGQPVDAASERPVSPAAFASAPCASSSSVVAASPAVTASISGDDSVSGFAFGFAFAPCSSSSFTVAAFPGLRAAIISAVCMSSDFAFTSAPCPSSTRVFSRFVAAHISAVAFASFFRLGSAPIASSRSSVAGPAYSTAYINGVDPSGPRAFSSDGSACAAFINPARSFSRSDSTNATAFALGGGRSTSFASASGHSAPCSIHALIVAICSGFNPPSGGIGPKCPATR